MVIPLPRHAPISYEETRCQAISSKRKRIKNHLRIYPREIDLNKQETLNKEPETSNLQLIQLFLRLNTTTHRFG